MATKKAEKPDGTPEVKPEVVPAPVAPVEPVAPVAPVVPAVAEAPKERPKDVKVYLTTQFETNDVKYGEPEREDEDGGLIVTEVFVDEDVAEDLRRRQREYDKSQRERFQSRTFQVNGRTGNTDLVRS